jgi:hypothetical protein
VQKPTTSAPSRSTESLTIQALADDAAYWREETARYRELAVAALQALAILTTERNRARDAVHDLRSELRRYTASQVRPCV